jgi:hypothetical protein
MEGPTEKTVIKYSHDGWIYELNIIIEPSSVVARSKA